MGEGYFYSEGKSWIADDRKQIADFRLDDLRYPLLNLHHLEERMCQSGHYQAPGLLNRNDLMERIFSAIDELNLNAARQEVAPFVNNVRSLDLWSKDFFKAAAERIVIEGQM